jgi:hypothetical protein
VQSTAPGEEPVSVVDPAAHEMHSLTDDETVKDPGMHSVHDTAPGEVPVLVTDPAVHAMQSATVVDPTAVWYSPAVQPTHAVESTTVE